MKFRRRPKASEPSLGFDPADDFQEDSLEREIWSEEEEPQVWAISYADLLMVLLSFFIIFFSVQERNGAEGGLSQMALEIAKRFGGEASTGSDRQGSKDGEGRDPTSARMSAGEARRLTVDMSAMIAGLPSVEQSEMTVEEVHPYGLAVSFSEHIFSPGSYILADNGQEYLTELLKVLQKDREKLKLTFVGHADPEAISVRRTASIKDNFDLSALRASWSLKKAKDFGFQPDQLFVRAESSNTLGVRTLSIIIQPRMD